MNLQYMELGVTERTALVVNYRYLTSRPFGLDQSVVPLFESNSELQESE